MTTKNVAAVQSQMNGFNRHDLNAATAGYAQDVVFTDHAMNLSLKSPAEIKDHVRMYLDCASDGRIALQELVEAGDTVVVELTFSGTNDGPIGSMPATGRHVSLDAVDILRFNNNGEIVAEEWYYDQLSFMTQLGWIEPPQL